MPTNTKKLFNRKTLTDKEAYKFYRENAEHRNMDNISRREDFSKIVRDFYGKIARDMVDNPNGVFIEHFGYFTILMNPIKSTVTYKRPWSDKELFLNPHTNGRVFYPIFLPICDNFRFKLFIMDKAFNRNLKMRLKESLRKKVKYLNHYGILNSIFKNKK